MKVKRSRSELQRYLLLDGEGLCPRPARALGTEIPDHELDTTARRRINRAVSAYLNFIDSEHARLRRNARTLESELAKIDERLARPGVTPIRRLHLMQERHNLLAHGVPHSVPNEQALRDGFIANAAAFARLEGICYEVFREFGIAPEVLCSAGLRPDFHLIPGFLGQTG